MNTTNLIINTPRLSLVPIAPEFCQIIFQEYTKEIATFMFSQPSGNIADTTGFINNALEKMKAGKDIQQVILNFQTKEFLGCAGLHNIDTPTPALGIWIKKSSYGNKYGCEAMHGLMEWAEENLSFEYIKYPVAVKNIPSRKIAESLGGLLGEEFIGVKQNGEKMNEVEYRVYKKSRG